MGLVILVLFLACLRVRTPNQEASLPLCYLWYVLVSWPWAPQLHLRQMISSFYLSLPNKTVTQLGYISYDNRKWPKVKAGVSIPKTSVATSRLEMLRRLRNYKKFKLMMKSSETQQVQKEIHSLSPSNCSCSNASFHSERYHHPPTYSSQTHRCHSWFLSSSPFLCLIFHWFVKNCPILSTDRNIFKKCKLDHVTSFKIL